jgi:hypothetical protein
MQGIPHGPGGDSQAEAAMFVRYWWQVGRSPVALRLAALANKASGRITGRIGAVAQNAPCCLLHAPAARCN